MNGGVESVDPGNVAKEAERIGVEPAVTGTDDSFGPSLTMGSRQRSFGFSISRYVISTNKHHLRLERGLISGAMGIADKGLT